jgi:prepilin-type N-terminal cleavage/methylation domain-containing protein
MRVPSRRAQRLQGNPGFTLVEVLVSVTILTIVLAMVFTAFMHTRKIALRHQLDMDIMQHARIGLNEMARTIRMIGYGRDARKGQAALIEAAPFQIIFTANLDEQLAPADREAALPPGASLPLYDATTYVTPMQNYTTGAETYRWTLDTNGDGIVDHLDTNDNPEEKNTPQNLHDMVLIREVNGKADGQVTTGIRGPYDAYGEPTFLPPLFQYWLLEPDHSFSLLGDTNEDGQLTGDERYFRSITSQVVLRKIRRIRITVTAESDRPDPLNRAEYRSIQLSSGVTLRNMEHK